MGSLLLTQGGIVTSLTRKQIDRMDHQDLREALLQSANREALEAYYGPELYDELRTIAEAPDAHFGPGKKPRTVIVVHGILGGTLVDHSGWLNDRVWLDLAQLALGDGLTKLRLNPTGQTDAQSGVRILPGRPLRIYYEFTEQYLRWVGQHRVETFTYDWRRSIDHSANRLKHRIETLAAGKQDAQFTIVAHSMGCLVTRRMAQLHNDVSARHLEQAIFVAPPLWGSFEPASVYAENHNLVPWLNRLKAISGLDLVKKIMATFQTYPGLAELLPDPEMFPNSAFLYEPATWPNLPGLASILPSALKFKDSFRKPSEIMDRTSILLGHTHKTLGGARTTADGKLDFLANPYGGDGTVPAQSTRDPQAAPRHFLSTAKHSGMQKNLTALKAIASLIKSMGKDPGPLERAAELEDIETYGAPKLAQPLPEPSADNIEQLRQRIEEGTWTGDDVLWIFGDLEQAAAPATTTAPQPTPPTPDSPQNIDGDDDDDGLLHFNGVRGDTGTYAYSPMTAHQLLAVIQNQDNEPELKSIHIAAAKNAELESYGPMGDPADLKQMGWGVIFAKDTPQEIKDALKPLIDHRKSQVSDRRFKTFDDVTVDTDAVDWLKDHNIPPGSVDPTKVPYYLMIVGSPESISFEFQFMIDVEYAVGRLDLDTVDDYKQYARSVVAHETGQTAASRKELVFWGPAHFGDKATQLSANHLLKPLVEGDKGPEAGLTSEPLSEYFDLQVQSHLKTKATKAQLSNIFHPRDEDKGNSRPAVVMTASHGVLWQRGDVRQRAHQGALVCQDWKGYGDAAPEHYFGASDLTDDAEVGGMVVFMFACSSAGTPKQPSFKLPTPDEDYSAPKPFVASLPKRLLSHPNGSALAVIGHVERAWGYSIRPRGMTGGQVLPFYHCLGYLFLGRPAGNSTEDFNQRYATLSTQLANKLNPASASGLAADADALIYPWIERNDAQNYVLLGDPAVVVRTA